jgi:uncharacterized protein (DUF1697 family)
MAETYVALLRGINVGGKNKLPMQHLAAMFVESGCSDVRTFIQSGNVIFRANAKHAARLATLIAAEIDKRFGYRTPVIVRTADQLRHVFGNNPYLVAGVAADFLHVMFLADLPLAGSVEALDPKRSPPDEFTVLGQHVYLHLPMGAGKSKLTNAYFDSKLKTIGTSRNWRTVTKLVELASN